MRNKETTFAVSLGIAILLALVYFAWIHKASGQEATAVDTEGSITADLFINAEGDGSVQVPDRVRSVTVIVDVHDSIDPLTEQIAILVNKVNELEAQVASLDVSVQLAHGPFGPSPEIEVEASLVNINTATAQELELLPHIGPVKAAAIVASRIEHGPFASVIGLVQVPGIGAATVEKLTPFITIGD